MQNFSSSSEEATGKFLKLLSSEVRTARHRSSSGKYILLIEEIDKIGEIEPSGVPKGPPRHFCY